MSSLREFSGRLKGKFISKSKLKGKKTRSLASRQRWNKFPEKKLEEAAAESGNIRTTKRRIVDLSQLAIDLWCRECNLPISLRNFEREKQHGLAFVMLVRCLSCNELVRVCTDKPGTSNANLFDVNTKLAVGIIDSGSGVDPVNNLFSALNVPIVCDTLVKRHERQVGPALLSLASESCARSIELEKTLSGSSETSNSDIISSPTVELNNTLGSDASSITNPPEEERTPNVSMPLPSHDICLSPPKKAKLIASFDAGWQQRGNQRSYNSMSGHASLIGYHSKKVLAYDVLSIRCRKCEAGHPPEDHNCCKNHSGSAKSMEPRMAVRMITQNKHLTEANAVVTTLIGDDDASTIHNVRRESEEPVEKWSDLNHVEKSFSSAFYDLKVDPLIRNYFRSCFGCIVHQNKDQPDQLRNDLLNATNHAFGDHANCGSWCRYDPENPEKYKHDGLPDGKDLTDLDLKAAVAKIFARYARSAEKIAPCGSSQLNENFNKIVSSKHPKDRHYAGSESLRYRVCSAVVHKNEGTNYVTELNKKLGISPGQETAKYRLKRDQKRAQRATKQASKECKRRRLFRKRNRCRRGVALEQKEGITYDSGCGLDGISDLIDDSSIPSRLPADTDTAVIYVDLETTGLSKLSCEILQIAATTCEGGEFSAFILPKKGISASASRVTGITISNGQLFRNDELLFTTPPRIAFNEFIEFLGKVRKPVVLAAHNGQKFDAPIILRQFRSIGLLSRLLEVVKGFIDTLHVLKEALPQRKESFKQTSLAALYNIETENAHDALGDVRMLSQIIVSAGINHSSMMRHAKTVASVVEREKMLANKNIIRCGLQVLKPLVSDSMISKMAEVGVSLDKLQTALKNGGEKGLAFLLGESVNNKLRITKAKKTVDGIITAVQASLGAHPANQELPKADEA